jgi:hypothetical protein
MTDDDAARIAACVKELGTLMNRVGSVPTEAQSRIMREGCTSAEAEAAFDLATCVLVETAGGDKVDPIPLTEAIRAMATVLSAMHRDSRKRTVTGSEVLRILATNFEAREKASSAIDRLLELIDSTRSRTAGDKPGSN